MKTKNIFRMLLVAATLLLGANNVKAGEETVWPLSGDNTSSNPIVIDANRFINNLTVTSIIRVYCGDKSINYWSLTFNSNNQSPDFANFPPDQKWGVNWAITKDTNPNIFDNKSYIELECDDQTVNKLSNGGLTINLMNIAVTRVTIVGQQTDPDETDPDQTVENVTATIGSTGYATFSNSSALNFSGISGMKAYVATAVSNNQVTLTQVTGAVAANTGLVIIGNNGNSGEFNIPKVTSGTSYDNNLLVAGNGYPLVLSDSYTDYVLIEDTDGQAKFAEVWSDDYLPTIGVGKAYLHVPTTNGARIRNLSIIINNGATGINAVENEQGESVIYNLRGQRVENPTKGLYIINGKKVILK